MILNPIEQSIKRKIEAIGTPLKDWDIKINRGILTGCNDAFIIDEAKKEELIKEDPKSAEIIRPILRGRDIKRYGYDFAGLYLIATHNGIPEKGIPRIKIDDYPAIKRHLNKYKREINARYDKGDTPYNLRSCAYWEDFNNQKIVYREISDVMDACIVDSRFVINNKCYMITGDHITYLISLLNSKLFTKIILPTANITGGKGGDFIQKITSPIPSNDVESILESLLKRREKANSQQVAFIDAEVDSLICKLFGLSKVECSYIMN